MALVKAITPVNVGSTARWIKGGAMEALKIGAGATIGGVVAGPAGAVVGGIKGKFIGDAYEFLVNGWRRMYRSSFKTGNPNGMNFVTDRNGIKAINPFNISELAMSLRIKIISGLANWKHSRIMRGLEKAQAAGVVDKLKNIDMSTYDGITNLNKYVNKGIANKWTYDPLVNAFMEAPKEARKFDLNALRYMDLKNLTPEKIATGTDLYDTAKMAKGVYSA